MRQLLQRRLRWLKRIKRTKLFCILPPWQWQWALTNIIDDPHSLLYPYILSLSYITLIMTQAIVFCGYLLASRRQPIIFSK
jgi:hypothetical protein